MPEETKPSETQTAPSRIIDDPMIAGLFEGLESVVAESKKPDEVPAAPAIKPAEEVKPVPAEVADPVEKPAKVSVKPREDLRSVVRDELSKLPLPPVAAKVPEPSKPALDESKLSDEQRDELELARFAELKDSKRAGLAEKLADFYREAEAYVEENKDGDRTFDSDDHEFVKWVKSKKPSFTPSEKDRLRSQKIAHDAKEAAKAEMQPELQRLSAELKEARTAPVIDKLVAKLDAALSEQTKTDDPLETDVYSQFRAAATSVSRDVVRLYHGLDQYNPQNQNHQWVANFIQAQGEVFQKSGGEALKRGGRQFVTMAEYQKMLASQDPKRESVWTFSAEDVIDRLGAYSIAQAKAQIKIEEDKAASRGFVRAKRTPQPETPPVPSTGPKVQPSLAPGVSNTPSDNTQLSAGAELISLLEL